jgi:hypothetical protein
MAFMINVYNAFEDPVRLLRNIAPAFKPGGTLAIVLDDPAKSCGESERAATREQFLANVDKAGFKVEKEETFRVVRIDQAALFRLGGDILREAEFQGDLVAFSIKHNAIIIGTIVPL